MAELVKISGINTANLPLYKDETMREMLNEIKNGNQDVKEEFIKGNLRLVLSVIQKFSGRGESADDLFQVGCIGLIKAVNNFDISHGVKFSTYAVPMIIGEIRRYLRDNNTIRVSRSMRDLAYKALSAREKLATKLQREPSVQEITDEINLMVNKNIPSNEGSDNADIKKEVDNNLSITIINEKVDVQDVVAALESIQDPVSLFEPAFHEDSDAIFIMDQISDIKNTDMKWIENISISEAMKKLSPRERHILTLRFFEGKTQMEVADEISISQAQVSRLEKNALNYMRKYV